MENVFQLPITNALNVFLNFTAAVNRTGYNVMWNESLCGRKGTHIANALINVLQRITLDNPLLEHLTLGQIAVSLKTEIQSARI